MFKPENQKYVGIAVGLGDDHVALPVGIGADLLALGAAGRAQPVGHLLALRGHPAVDRFGDVGDEVDPLDADVEDLDAERLGLVGERSRTSCMTFRARSRAAADGALVTSSLKAAWTIGASRASRLRISTPLLRMNWRGSVMRHLHSQSITRRFFSAVNIGRVSGLSRVWMRLSMKPTFWNGGGSLKFRPGSVITSLIWPNS